jgi:hypothetical protein
MTRAEMEAALLAVAREHYRGAKLADELEA